MGNAQVSGENADPGELGQRCQTTRELPIFVGPGHTVVGRRCNGEGQGWGRVAETLIPAFIPSLRQSTERAIPKSAEASQRIRSPIRGVTYGARA